MDLDPKLTFSDPRISLTVDDWPYGHHLRCVAHFQVERHENNKQRVGRQTQHPKTGVLSKPKYTTYAIRCALVTGSNGKTYILRDCGGMIEVFRGDMTHTAGAVWDRDPQYAGLMTLLDVCSTVWADADSAEMDELEAAGEVYDKRRAAIKNPTPHGRPLYR